jgi:CheY-like chemotaxis protein
LFSAFFPLSVMTSGALSAVSTFTMLAGSGPILVVEDDPTSRTALVALLESRGYDVAAAADGEEALARLRAPEPPALVVLDLMLPVMDGFEFRTRQMQQPELAEIPVIVLSGGGDLDRKSGPLHVEACFQKPLEPDALLDEVASRVGPGHGPLDQ